MKDSSLDSDKAQEQSMEREDTIGSSSDMWIAYLSDVVQYHGTIFRFKYYDYKLLLSYHRPHPCSGAPQSQSQLSIVALGL